MYGVISVEQGHGLQVVLENGNYGSYVHLGNETVESIVGGGDSVTVVTVPANCRSHKNLYVYSLPSLTITSATTMPA